MASSPKEKGVAVHWPVNRKNTSFWRKNLTNFTSVWSIEKHTDFFFFQLLTWNSGYSHNSSDNIGIHNSQFKIHSLGWLFSLCSFINATWVGKQRERHFVVHRAWEEVSVAESQQGCDRDAGSTEGTVLHKCSSFGSSPLQICYIHVGQFCFQTSQAHGKTQIFAFSWTGIYPNAPGTILGTAFIDIQGRFVVTKKVHAH